MKALKQEGFVAVINLRQASEPGADVDAGRTAAQSAGLKYIHLPFNAQAPDPAVVDRFLENNRERVEKGGKFSHLSDAEREDVLRRAKRMARIGGSSLTENGMRGAMARSFATASRKI